MRKSSKLVVAMVVVFVSLCSSGLLAEDGDVETLIREVIMGALQAENASVEPEAQERLNRLFSAGAKRLREDGDTAASRKRAVAGLEDFAKKLLELGSLGESPAVIGVSTVESAIGFCPFYPIC